MSFSITSQQLSIDRGKKSLRDAILFFHVFPPRSLPLSPFVFHMVVAFEQINKRQY